jgi:hypothetical protein
MVSWAIELTSQSPGFSLNVGIRFGRLLTDGSSLTLELLDRAWTEGLYGPLLADLLEMRPLRRRRETVLISANRGCEGPQSFRLHRSSLPSLANLDDCTDGANIENSSSLPLGTDSNASVAGGMAGINAIVNAYFGK